MRRAMVLNSMATPRFMAASCLAALVAALAMSGCESTRAGASSGSDSSSSSGKGTVATRRPTAYHPEQFPDIPFNYLVGYRLTAEDQQLAIAAAGGALRRLSVTFITKEGDEPRAAVAESDRIAAGISGLGWRSGALPTEVQNTPNDQTSVYSKGDETLTVRVINDRSATTISCQLEPHALR